MPNHHPLRLIAAATLAAMTFTLGSCKSPGPTGRCLMIGSDTALELDFDRPVAITVEALAADGKSWEATAYALITPNISRVAIIRPVGTEDLRFTLGVDGKLFDQNDGSMVADGSSLVVESLSKRPIAIRDASIGSQLQIRNGTIATIQLDQVNKITLTTTRPFPR